MLDRKYFYLRAEILKKTEVSRGISLFVNNFYRMRYDVVNVFTVAFQAVFLNQNNINNAAVCDGNTL